MLQLYAVSADSHVQEAEALFQKGLHLRDVAQQSLDRAAQLSLELAQFMDSEEPEPVAEEDVAW